MAVNFITENPVARGWDQQQARTDAAVASDLRRVQAGDAVEQSRQRRGEVQAMNDVLNSGQGGTDSLEVMRRLAQAPGVLPATRVNLMSGIAQVEQQRAAAARAQAAQQSLEEYRRERIRQGDATENRRAANPSGPMVIVAGPDGQPVYARGSAAVGQPAAPRPSATGTSPFPDNSMEGRARNILNRANQPGGDPNSLEYWQAHQYLSRSRTVQIPDPNDPTRMLPATLQPEDLSRYVPPGWRGSAGGAPPSAGEAPRSPAAAPDGAPIGEAAPPAGPAAAPPGRAPAQPPVQTSQAAPQQPGAVPGRPQPQPLGQRAPREAPTHFANAMADNVRAMRDIDRVLEAVDRYRSATGPLTGLANRTELTRSLWDSMADPQGVAARAALSNLSSLVIKDRSGAAVTGAEFQRLGFIPSMSDDYATVRRKLQAFRAFVQDHLQAIYGDYGPERGFAPLPSVEPFINRRAPGAPAPEPGSRSGPPAVVPQDRRGAPAPAAPSAAPPPGTAPGYRIENGRLVPNQRSDAAGPASDFGDGMGSGDRAQVPEPYRTRGLIRDDYGNDVAPSQMMPGGFAPNGYRPESEYTNPGPSPARPAAGGPPMPAGARQPAGSPQMALPRGTQAPYGPGYVETLFAQEGTGVNPRSSAAGYGQFLEGTWLGRPDAPGVVARIAAGNPNVQALLRQAWAGDPAARQRLLALRNDPQVARAAVGEYVRQTAATFRNAGIPVDDTNLALAHFFGPAGATRFLRALQADPNTPITRIVPPAVLRANPEVLMPGGQPITAGALYAQYARRYGGQAPAEAMPPPSMGSNPGIAPLAAPPAQAAEPAMPSLGEMPPVPGPGAAPAAAPQIAVPPTAPPPTSTPPTSTPPTSTPPTSTPPTPTAAEMVDSATPDQAQGDAPLAPPNGSSAASPVSSGRREPTAQERLAAELRGVVGRMPTAGTPPGPFALSDPATIREARDRFAQSGRAADWNAGVASFLEDRFARAMERSSSPHDFQRAVFASPRERALLMATMTPEQQNAFRDLIRVTDLASRGSAPGPIADLAQGIYTGRGAGTLARLLTDPEAVAQLQALRQIAPDSPRALQIVQGLLTRAAAPEAPPATVPAGMPRFRVEGGQLVPVTE